MHQQAALLNGGDLYSMARYKPYDTNQVTLIAVSFPDQILSVSFEYALNEIVDQHLDMRPFEASYNNDETGYLAYDPWPSSGMRADRAARKR